MSKLVAFAAIQGGYKVVSTAEGLYRKALDTYNADTKIGFPNTAYYLPVIYSLTGMKVETLEDLKKPWILPAVCCRRTSRAEPPALPGAPAGCRYGQYLQLRDHGSPAHPGSAGFLPSRGRSGHRSPASSGSARPTTPSCVNAVWNSSTVRPPGFAAMVGAAPNKEIAKDIVEDYQKRSLYIFCAASHNGTTLIEQLLDAGVQVGWNTRIVPFGPDISSAVFALGFANRAAMAFGGVQPGDYKKILTYNKDRVFAFRQCAWRCGHRVGRGRCRLRQLGFPDPGRHRHSRNPAHRYLYLRARGCQRLPRGNVSTLRGSPRPQDHHL